MKLYQLESIQAVKKLFGSHKCNYTIPGGGASTTTHSSRGWSFYYYTQFQGVELLLLHIQSSQLTPPLCETTATPSFPCGTYLPPTLEDKEKQTINIFTIIYYFSQAPPSVTTTAQRAQLTKSGHLPCLK